MEPGSAAQKPSPEMVAYQAPETPVKPGETSGIPAEHAAPAPERHEGQPMPSVGPPAATSPAVQLPTLPTPQQVAAPISPAPADDNPLMAADEDVVEKEWVDKAKKIVAQTKDDPFAQEKEVSKLQADYLKKRYGKDIKLNSD